MNANPASFLSRSSDGSAVATTPPEQEDWLQNYMEMSGVLPTVDYSEAAEDVTGPSSMSSVASSPSDDGEGFHHGIMDGFAALDTPPFPSWPGYSSVSEMDGVQESRDGTFLPGSALGHNFSTIPEDSEDGNDGDLFQDYDSVLEPLNAALSEQDDDPDDTKKFYLGDEEEIDYYKKPTYQQITPLTEIDFDDFYQESDSQPMLTTTDVANPGLPPAGQEEHDYLDEESNDEAFGADHFHGTTHERNLTIDQFIRQWLAQSTISPFQQFLPPHVPRLSPQAATNVSDWTRPERIVRPSHYPYDVYDIQQIPWREKLRVRRSDARALRDAWYTSYHNLDYSPPEFENKLPRHEFYFQGKAMYTKHRAMIEHFQLRNLMSVTSHNTVQFAYNSRLYSWTPAYDYISCLIDLSKPSVESGLQGKVKISTMKSKYGISIAGGFCGEYALHVEGVEGAVEGIVTKDYNGITNHIDIIQRRTSRSPVAVFASNDKRLRILDCETNTFISEHTLSRAINCTDTSPDGRLRVVIGDSPDAWVIEAETGRPIQPLRGHRDFGFACAWSPDMLHIATSNQDKTVNIWDVRMWRILQTIDSDLAGYRSLRFSPVGGGPRTLLMCEPADRIAIVNAQTYQTRQVHDFFGEIGGADYAPDGGSIWVANADNCFGGFMEYERKQWGQQFGLSFTKKREIEARGDEYRPDLPNEWLCESELDDDERCVLSARERQLRFVRNLSEEEHDDLLL
ncbi:hypothetical protein VTN02DRAFT_2709 [Thermoascus thermophilus]